MLFGGNDFIAVAGLVAVVIHFECVDFVALAAAHVAAIHASFVDFVEIVVVVHDVDLR